MKPNKPQARKRRALFWVVLVVVALAAGAFGVYTRFYLKHPAPAVRQAVVRVKIPSMPAPPAMTTSENQSVRPETGGSETRHPTGGVSGQRHETGVAATGHNTTLPPSPPSAAAGHGRQAIASREVPADNPPAPGNPRTVVIQNTPEKSEQSMSNDNHPSAAAPSDNPTAKDADVNRTVASAAPNGARAPEHAAAEPSSSVQLTGPESSRSTSPDHVQPQNSPEPLAPFTIQVGAYLTKAYADETVLRLMKKGYGAYIFQRTDKRQRVWYLVRFGQFQDREAAVRALTIFKDQERMDASVALTKKI